jgi:hypothetical protein
VPSLPPPYTYEDVYSSYQKEWDLQRKTSSTGDSVDNIDESVTDLEWVTLPSGDETFLLACTSSGNVLAWKLARTATESNTEEETAEDASNSRRRKADPALLLQPHARLTIYSDSLGAEEDSGDAGEGDGRKVLLRSMCIVASVSTINMGGSGRPYKGPGKKRQRPYNEIDGSNSTELLTLIVGGDGGVWTVSMEEFLNQPWQPPAATNNSKLPPSLVRLSSRPCSKLQVTPCTTNDQQQEMIPSWLFALEHETNTLAMWYIASIFSSRTMENVSTFLGVSEKPSLVVPEKRIDLSQSFSSASNKPTSTLSSKRRKISNCNERSTTMNVVPRDGKSYSQLLVLVGTDRSRLWAFHLPNGKWIGEESVKAQAPRFLSLGGDDGKPEQARPPNARKGGRGSAKAAKGPSWRVTDILDANGGTWWTVSASINGTNTSNTNNNTGLLMTWHAPTGMVVARHETREAVKAISLDHQEQALYSVANEGAVSFWESAFKLTQRRRFWTSPPSSKALAVSWFEHPNGGGDERLLAVAGVGTTVDLFLDHCRVQTVRIIPSRRPDSK